ncbi:MAG: HepT-like ribonuclease domain-containing protein [Bacteroidota bacterium]
MKPEERDYRLYIQDMVEYLFKVEDLVSGLNYEDFILNSTVMDAVCWNLEKIGEASNHVSDEIKKANPQIEWEKIYRVRNILSHHYHKIDYAIIWKIATQYLPLDKPHLVQLLIEQSPR